MTVTAKTESLPLIVRLLVESGQLPAEKLDQLTRARQQFPESVEEALIASELVEENPLAETWAKHLHIPWVELVVDGATSLAMLNLPGELLPLSLGTVPELAAAAGPLAQLVSESVCRRRRLFPVRDAGRFLEVACLNPADFAALEEVRMRTGRIVRPAAISPLLYSLLLAAVFGERDVVREIVSEGGKAEMSAKAEEAEEEMDFILDLQRPLPAGRDSQVIRIVNVLLSRAIEEGASDIHIEPYEDTVRVRYRVDGKLRETTSPPRSLFVPTVSRLKILSKMDIAEKRVPQDGAIALRNGEKRVDLRVSTVPTIYGEKMVIRILEKEGIPDKLEKLGFNTKQAADFVAAAHSPHGLMFVTGPTGSGKSTTLYCCLNLINSPTENIVTVEDPVEYKFFGLNQVQVRAQQGLTFAGALRSFLRQDPDKIMVGEVRDQETAQICMRAALTGHLVLSTLHTNNALQVINRLVDMGIEPFLLGPALRMVEAQRLVRRLCPECKIAYELPEEVAVKYGLEPKITLYRAGTNTNCLNCRGNGVRGRVGIYEVIPISEAVRECICRKAPVAEIEKTARSEGTRFLMDSARERLVAGITSLEECIEYLRKDP
jgi:type IV pilus assembly protein PilB